MHRNKFGNELVSLRITGTDTEFAAALHTAVLIADTFIDDTDDDDLSDWDTARLEIAWPALLIKDGWIQQLSQLMGVEAGVANAAYTPAVRRSQYVLNGVGRRVHATHQTLSILVLPRINAEAMRMLDDTDVTNHIAAASRTWTQPLISI